MKDIKSTERSLFSFHDPQTVKLFPRLGLNFSRLNEDKFRHNFKECVSFVYECALEKLNQLSTFSCVAIFIMLKDRNFLNYKLTL